MPQVAHQINNKSYGNGYDNFANKGNVNDNGSIYATTSLKFVRNSNIHGTTEFAKSNSPSEFDSHSQRPPRRRPVRDPLDSDDELFNDDPPLRTATKRLPSGNDHTLPLNKFDPSFLDFLSNSGPDNLSNPPPRRSSMMPPRNASSNTLNGNDRVKSPARRKANKTSVGSDHDDYFDDDDDLDFEFGSPKPKPKRKTETSDLADFLMSTGPQENLETPLYSADRNSNDRQAKWLTPILGGLWKRPSASDLAPSASTPVSSQRPKSKYVPLVPQRLPGIKSLPDTRFSRSTSTLNSNKAIPLPTPPAPVSYPMPRKTNGNYTPSINGGYAPSVNGTYAPTTNGNYSPSVNGSQAPLINGNYASSTNGRYTPSISGSLVRRPSERGSISTDSVIRDDAEQLEVTRQLHETSLSQIRYMEILIRQQQQQLESRPLRPITRDSDVQTEASQEPSPSTSPPPLSFSNELEPTDNENVNLRTENAYLTAALHALQKQLVRERRANEGLAATISDNTKRFETLSIMACEKYAELWNDKCYFEDMANGLQGRVEALLEVAEVEAVGGLEVKMSSTLLVNDIRSKRRSYFA